MFRIVLLSLVLAACGGATAPKVTPTNSPPVSPPSPAPTTGTLVVTVTPPTGVTPTVVVSGPNGYTMTIWATDTLKNLAAGNYTIVPDTVAVPDSVVGSVLSTGTVTGSPATVAANTTAAASVAYGETSRRGGVWITNQLGTAIALYGAADLRASGTPTSADTIGGIPNSTGIAIDASGNLWVASVQPNTLRMYTIAQRGGGGSPTPAVEITSPSLGTPNWLAFDANGTLWVADTTNGLLGFTKNQLSTTGTVTAAYTIADTGANPGAKAVAFDANGNAWVIGGQLDAPEIAEYAAAQLTTSGRPLPQATIPPMNISGVLIYSLTFDSSGHLWVGGFGNVYQYPANSTKISEGLALLAGDAAMSGLAFDRRGTLWVLQAEGNFESGLNAFPAAVLATTNPQPSIFVQFGPSVVCPCQLAFDPFTPTPVSPSNANDVSEHALRSRASTVTAEPHAGGTRRVAPRTPGRADPIQRGQ